jgi:Protein of unknown function (DUF2934)
MDDKEQRIREIAYSLWEEEGYPEGRAESIGPRRKPSSTRRMGNVRISRMVRGGSLSSAKRVSGLPNNGRH